MANQNKEIEESKEDNIPPIIPPEGNEGETSPEWKKDFEVYLNEVREAFRQIKSDQEWIAKQERFNPGIDILKSVEKSCVNYWATESGWKKRKKSRTKKIDWKTTFANAIPQPMNRVWKDRFAVKEPETTKTEKHEVW